MYTINSKRAFSVHSIIKSISLKNIILFLSSNKEIIAIILTREVQCVVMAMKSLVAMSYMAACAWNIEL